MSEDDQVAIGAAAHEIAQGLFAVSHTLQRLGTAEASTPFGAIELLSLEIKEGTTRIADGLGEIAQALLQEKTRS